MLPSNSLTGRLVGAKFRLVGPQHFMPELCWLVSVLECEFKSGESIAHAQQRLLACYLATHLVAVGQILHRLRRGFNYRRNLQHEFCAIDAWVLAHLAQHSQFIWGANTDA